MLDNGDFALFFKFDKNMIFDCFSKRNFTKKQIIYTLIKFIKKNY